MVKAVFRGWGPAPGRWSTAVVSVVFALPRRASLPSRKGLTAKTLEKVGPPPDTGELSQGRRGRCDNRAAVQEGSRLPGRVEAYIQIRHSISDLNSVGESGNSAEEKPAGELSSEEKVPRRDETAAQVPLIMTRTVKWRLFGVPVTSK